MKNFFPIFFLRFFFFIFQQFVLKAAAGNTVRAGTLARADAASDGLDQTVQSAFHIQDVLMARAGNLGNVDASQAGLAISAKKN